MNDYTSARRGSAEFILRASAGPASMTFRVRSEGMWILGWIERAINHVATGALGFEALEAIVVRCVWTPNINSLLIRGVENVLPEIAYRSRGVRGGFAGVIGSPNLGSALRRAYRDQLVTKEALAAAITFAAVVLPLPGDQRSQSPVPFQLGIELPGEVLPPLWGVRPDVPHGQWLPEVERIEP